MRRSAVMAVLLAVATAGPALAVQDPQAGRFDSRVRTVAYTR